MTSKRCDSITYRHTLALATQRIVNTASVSSAQAASRYRQQADTGSNEQIQVESKYKEGQIAPDRFNHAKSFFSLNSTALTGYDITLSFS